MAQLHRQRVGQSVHCQLIIVLGVDHQEIGLVLFDQLNVFLQPVAQRHGLFHVDVHFGLLQHLLAGGNVFGRVLEQLLGEFLTGGFGVNIWNLRDRLQHSLQRRIVLDVRERKRAARLRESNRVVHQTMVAREMIGDRHHRIGISHPISDNQMLFFSYGHFSKRPKPQFVYAKLDSNSAKSTFQKFGNPNLGFETTVAYEFGLRHKFSDNDVLTLTGYYRDIFDYVTTVSFGGTGRLAGRPFTTYLNLDYARSRGVEFEYRKRAGVLSGSVSGAYQIATGKSSTPDDAFLVAQGSLNEKPITEDFLIWDRPWQISAVLNLNVPKGQGRVFGIKIPSDWNLNVRFFAQAGKRYTPFVLLRDSNGDPVTSTNGRPVYDDDFDQNGEADDRFGKVGTTWSWINVNFEKYFRAFGLKYTFLVEVVNLLDRNNPQILNPVTGQAYEFGDPTPTFFNDPLFPDTQAPVSPFPFNPARFLTQRNVRVGLTVRF